MQVSMVQFFRFNSLLLLLVHHTVVTSSSYQGISFKSQPFNHSLKSKTIRQTEILSSQWHLHYDFENLTLWTYTKTIKWHNFTWLTIDPFRGMHIIKTENKFIHHQDLMQIFTSVKEDSLKLCNDSFVYRVWNVHTKRKKNKTKKNIVIELQKWSFYVKIYHFREIFYSKTSVWSVVRNSAQKKNKIISF